MSSSTLNFVLSDPNGAADRIEALENALRAIADPDNDLMISEMEDIASDALAPASAALQRGKPARLAEAKRRQEQDK